MKKKALIEIKELNYKNIFQDLNLIIEENKITAISGPNNAGKTTLIKIINTLITTENSVFYNQTPIEQINKNKLFTEMGIVMLEDKIEFNNFTVEEELFNILENLQTDQKKKIIKYQKIVKLLKIEEILTRDPNSLNRNEKMKLLLATALLSSPKILLIDNVCTLMSKIETKEILEIIKELNKKEHITIVMTTDNLNEVIEADYLYIINHGKVVLEGQPLEILKEDNKISKIGLDIPFMIDLSVKLNDYNLVDDLILDMDGMVDTLWK